MIHSLKTLVLMLVLATTLTAQSRQSDIVGQRVLGNAVASQFAQWSIPVKEGVVAAPGSATITLEYDHGTVPDGTNIPVITTGIPITIDDFTNTEVITPSSANCQIGSGICTFTATFTKSHPGRFKVTTGTAGLQEAINFMVSAGNGSGGLVIITADWRGTTSTITSAAGNSNVNLLDLRAGGLNVWTWNGSAYVQTFGTAVGGGAALTDHNIRKCDSYPGSTAGEKIVNCIADLPSSGGTADARGLEGGTVSQNIFSGVTKPVTLQLGAGTYNASVAQTFGASNLRVLGLGPSTIWQYSGGATTYIWGDNGSTSTLYFKNEISDMKILGNASVTNGLNINSMHHSVFRNLSIGNVAGACFWIGFAVTNDYDNPHCTNNDMAGGIFSTTPVNGMLFQGLDSAHYATGSNISKPVIESVSGSGIKLRYSQALHFLGGTSESNNINIETLSGGANQTDTFDSMDLELPTTRHILSESCSNCTWINILMDNTAAKGASFTAGTSNTLIGGQWTNLTIGAGAVATELHNVFYATNGAGCGGFTDNSSSTLIYRLIKYDCTAVTFTPYAKIGIIDDFDFWNQQAQPTTGYIRQSQSNQGGVDLLQFTDYTRGTVLSRVFSSGGMRIGRSDQGNVALQIGDGTHEGYVEFNIGATRYGYLGQGTSTSVPLVLENGATFNINGGLAAANLGLNVSGAPLAVSGFGIVSGSPTGGDKGSGTINATGYYANGTAGFTGTKSVRKGDDTGACDLNFTNGLLTSSTC